MQSTYIASTIYAVRSKGSASLSFNDYSNLLCERFDITSSSLVSSSCCCCCDCCAYSSYRAPINPSPLCVLRQSALLQWSSSRRVILNGLQRYLTRIPVHGINRGYYEVNCSVKDGDFCNRSRRRVRERCYCKVSEEDSEIRHSGGSDDVDAVLSLLIEEADRGFINASRKNVSSFKKLEVEKKKKVRSREKSSSSGKKVEVEKKGNLKHRGTLAIELKKEDEKPHEERETSIKGENCGRRRDASSCSSYYSLSSLEDFGNDDEVQHKQGQSTEELSLAYENNIRNHQEEEMKEEYNWQKDDSGKFERISNQERNAFGAEIDWNLRKKSEKKLTDVTVDENKSRMESEDTHLRVSRTSESSYGKSSISEKQFDTEEEDSSLVIDMDKKTRKGYIQTEDRRKYQSTELQQFGRDEVETTKKSQKAHSGREGKLEIAETMLQETDEEHLSSTTRKDVINRNSQKYTGKSKLQDTEMASSTRMKHLGDNKFSVSSSVKDKEEKRCQREEKIVTQVEERRTSHSQQVSELAKVHESNENVSVLSSRTRIKNWEDYRNLSSNEDKMYPQTVRRTPQSIQPMKGSEFVSISSEVQAHDATIGSSSQRTSEGVPSNHFVNTRDSHCQTDEKITQFEQSNAAQRLTNLSISSESTLRKASSFQGSLNLVSEASRQHIISTEDNQRNSEIMLMPSSSRLVARGSTDIQLSTRNASSEVFPETSESGSSALYYSGMNPPLISEPFSRDESDQAYSEPLNIIVPEDSLDSVHRLEQSSAQFVEEFVEKVRHEARTSGTLEIGATGTNLALEETNRTSVLRQKGSQNGSRLQDHDTNRSSGGSGTKGPSVEMWDVTEPSDKQSATVDEPEVSVETKKPIVKRSGRSLWNIISDIVQLRWGSRTDVSTSAARSGDKNSLNKSDSETYFSGHEHEEVSKSIVKKEKSSVPAQAQTSNRPQPGKPYTQSEVEASDPMKSKDKAKDLDVGVPLSSNILKGESPSAGTSIAAGEESTSLTEDVKNLQATRSDAGTLELSISLPAGAPPSVKETEISGISGTAKAESQVPMKIPVPSAQTELSSAGRKDGELKQRKLQRKQQVARDRFDEWEEAYNLELKQRKMDEMFMREALLEAKKAADTWEVPVGAVLVQHGKIIARGCNLVEALRDSTAHAEMICIREASNILRTWRLAETTLYVTLEPCPMCAGAILQARIDTIVWGAPNKLLGADGSWVRLFPDGREGGSEPSDKPAAPVHPFHPKMNIRRGVLASECADVMQQFFQLRRKKKKEEEPSQRSRLSASHHPSKFFNKMHDIFHMMFCL